MVAVSIGNARERFESWGNRGKQGFGLGGFGGLTPDPTGRHVLDGLQAAGLPIESLVSGKK
jgi:hypothetical protein